MNFLIPSLGRWSTIFLIRKFLVIFKILLEILFSYSVGIYTYSELLDSFLSSSKDDFKELESSLKNNVLKIVGF